VGTFGEDLVHVQQCHLTEENHGHSNGRWSQLSGGGH
jgi:hypothetical protein